MSGRRSRLLLAVGAAALLAACGRASPSGPVRTPDEARAAAEQALRSAHLDEEIVAVDRQDGAWIVTTRWRDSPVAGHLVTVDPATGAARFERYNTLQLVGP